MTLALTSLIFIVFSNVSVVYGSTYYFLNLTCDLFPFIPFWVLLFALWPIILLFSSQGKVSVIKAIVLIAVMIMMVTTLPHIYPVSLIIFSLLSLYFLIDYILLWRNRHDEKMRLLFRMESMLLLAALLSALLITLVYHTPRVLVYRLRFSSTFLVEEWIRKGGKGFDDALAGALLDRGTPDRMKILHLLMERKNAIAVTDLHTILSHRDEDRELTIAVIDYLGQIKSTESLPLLVALLTEQELSSLSGTSRDSALIESLYNAIESIDTDKALALLNEKLSSRGELLAFITLNLNKAPYTDGNYRKILAGIPPEALLTLLSRSSISEKELRRDIITGLTANHSSDIIIKALMDICKKNDRDNIPLLIALLKDSNADVRSTANWALINMTEENFDFDAEGAPDERERSILQWEEWYKRLKDDSKH